jgi:hypothetical protein
MATNLVTECPCSRLVPVTDGGGEAWDGPEAVMTT